MISTFRVGSSMNQIFAKYEDQRQWIIEEILSALGKISTHNNVQSRFLCESAIRTVPLR